MGRYSVDTAKRLSIPAPTSSTITRSCQKKLSSHTWTNQGNLFVLAPENFLKRRVARSEVVAPPIRVRNFASNSLQKCRSSSPRPFWSSSTRPWPGTNTTRLSQALSFRRYCLLRLPMTCYWHHTQPVFLSTLNSTLREKDTASGYHNYCTAVLGCPILNQCPIGPGGRAVSHLCIPFNML